MPSDRFYFKGPLSGDITLEDSEFHHLRVSRIDINEEVEIVNGQGALATAKLTAINKRSAHLQILKTHTIPHSAHQIILSIPYMRPSKLEYVIEKGTELGADAFHIYPAYHSEKSTLSPNQLERLHNLSVSALKQSGRLYLPAIELYANFQRLLSTHLLYGDTNPSAPSLLSVELPSTIVFVTGPERGFTAEEISLLSTKGKGVSLNPNTLRAETAPLAALSILALRTI